MSSLALFLIEQLAGCIVTDLYGKAKDYVEEKEEIKQQLMKQAMAIVEDRCKDLKDGEMKVTVTSKYVEK